MQVSRLFPSVVAALACVSAHAAETPAVKAGMSPEEVIAALGQPDRIAVPKGKYLRDASLAAAAAADAEGRFVFIYRAGLNVWFVRGRASGLIQGGGPASNPTGGAKPE
jgi:hypothetical protein